MCEALEGVGEEARLRFPRRERMFPAMFAGVRFCSRDGGEIWGRKDDMRLRKHAVSIPLVGLVDKEHIDDKATIGQRKHTEGSKHINKGDQRGC